MDTITAMPEESLLTLERLGYQPVKPADQMIFSPYYDRMNGHWSSATCFLCLAAYEGTITAFYKKAGEVLLCLEYDAIAGELVAIPFIGRYTQETVSCAFQILQSDMAALDVPLVVMDIVPWMLPFYDRIGVSWEITDLRSLRDYIYQRSDFLASMESSDNRYRYRYFVRRYAPETITLTKELWRDCIDFMEEFWCPHRDCSSCHYGCPRDTVANVMRDFEHMEADGILVRVDGRPVGFCITNCRNGLGIYQFKMANNHIKGVNEYLLRECFDRFLTDAEEINYTEDMGLEHLRAYKTRLSPHTLQPRLTLRAKSSDRRGDKRRIGDALFPVCAESPAVYLHDCVPRGDVRIFPELSVPDSRQPIQTFRNLYRARLSD